MKSQYKQNYDHSCTHLARHSHTWNIIRSVIDELYQINHDESKEKRVRFTVEDEGDRTESSTVVCSSINERSKVDCSVSTNDFPSLRCECATQTMYPKDHHSFSSSLTDSDDLHRSKSDQTLSRTSLSLKSTIDYPLYFCENSETLPSISTSHQLVLPSDAQNYPICEEQTEDNLDSFSTYTMRTFNSSIQSEELTQFNDCHSSPKSKENLIGTNIKICRCSKRKLSDNHSLLNNCTSFHPGKLLEELHLSPRSLQSMYNDGLFYIHDLVLIFLQNTSQFEQILLEHYHLSNRQAQLFVKVMENWWEKHRHDLLEKE